ncbi:MAG: class I SAM-dependent methyltransferase [Candidatus Thermoplasmatota archaeon]|nr:class I SAM-dependent methyltransferase [Candidatus Thermoplasmatota archaeon]
MIDVEKLRKPFSGDDSLSNNAFRPENDFECEDGCGCRFKGKDAFISRIEGMDHYFCCSDCADGYQRRISSETEKVIRAHVHEGYTVADIGCGNGNYTSLLSELVGTGGMVYATDLNPEMTGKTLANLGEASRKRVRMHTSAAHDLSFIESGTVDFVLCNNVLCCTNRRDLVVREIGRILRPGGSAYIRVSRISVEGVSQITDAEWGKLFSSFAHIECGSDVGLRWAILSA